LDKRIKCLAKIENKLKLDNIKTNYKINRPAYNVDGVNYGVKLSNFNEKSEISELFNNQTQYLANFISIFVRFFKKFKDYITFYIKRCLVKFRRNNAAKTNELLDEYSKLQARRDEDLVWSIEDAAELAYSRAKFVGFKQKPIIKLRNSIGFTDFDFFMNRDRFFRDNSLEYNNDLNNDLDNYVIVKDTNPLNEANRLRQDNIRVVHDNPTLNNVQEIANVQEVYNTQEHVQEADNT
jgi:hypothetical protein